MRHFFAIIMLVLLSVAVAGCNTTRGVGQDIEAAGDTIQDVADDARDEISDD